MVRKMQMFADGRSRKVVFLAHCLLNQNAISDGTAVYPAAFRELVQFFLEHQVGIVQLPCPELCCLGLDRGNRLGAQSPGHRRKHPYSCRHAGARPQPDTGGPS